MTVDKISVTITPELHSALTLAALRNKTNVSRQLEFYLRENAEVQKFIRIVRAEPDEGVLAVHPEFIRELKKRRVRVATPAA